MDVPVKDAHLTLVEFFLGNSGSYCHIVEKTEAVYGGAMCMMSWRPHMAKIESIGLMTVSPHRALIASTVPPADK